MKLVVGLGNPGRKYEGTRHNVGFAVLAELARKYSDGRPKSAFQGEILDAKLGGERAILLAPHTLMNRSGASVLAARDFYKLPAGDLLVICDDLNLPLGKVRMRAGGSSGGQKGLENIIQRLGGDGFPRLRIGIGAAPEGWDAADYVLGKFTKQEVAEIEPAVWRAADAVEAWARDGVDDCMNRYN